MSRRARPSSVFLPFSYLPQRSGFTLVELLVVITIIGILMGLLVPAVQTARETGRQAVCKNNLANIGKALSQYEQVRQCLPYGGWSYKDSNVPTPTGTDGDLPRRGYGSMLFFLLPFLDNEALYDNMMTNWTTIVAGTNSGDTSGRLIKVEAYTIAGGHNAPMPIFVCPSDDLRGTETSSQDAMRGDYGPATLTSYAGSCGPRDIGTCTFKMNGNSMQMTNMKDPTSGLYFKYAGATSNQNTQRYLGPFLFNGSNNGYNYKTFPPVRLEMIHDGLSNTIFVGEVRPYCTWAAYSYGWASSDNGCGQIATEIPINYNTCTAPSSSAAPNNPDTSAGYYSSCMSYGFKSRHPGGAHFIMGDNSVVFLKETMDHMTYQYLGAIDDGNAVSVPMP